MRARLLDMGEVAPVRSQSFWRAIAALAEGEQTPALVLLQPAAPLVLLGRGAELEPEEASTCRDREVPVLPWPGRDLRRLDGAKLVFQLIVPAAARPVHGSATDPGGALVSIMARACRQAGLGEIATEESRVLLSGAELAAGGVEEREECVVMMGDLDVALAARHGVAPEALAEAVVVTLEEALGVIFEPSMPTPGEMEEIYQSDRRLALEERSGLAALAAGTA